MARRQRRSEAGPGVGNLEHDTTTNEPRPAVDTIAVAGHQLKSFFERVERLAEERKAISDDIREVFAEAKGNGFDPKVMRILLRRRAMDAGDRAEQDALVDIYTTAVGE